MANQDAVVAMKPGSQEELTWLDEAFDEFMTVFGPAGASKASSDAYIHKWRCRCTSKVQVQAFEQAMRSWLELRAALLCEETAKADGKSLRKRIEVQRRMSQDRQKSRGFTRRGRG